VLTPWRRHRIGERQIGLSTRFGSLELQYLRCFIPKVFSEFGENEPVLFLALVPLLTNERVSVFNEPNAANISIADLPI